MPNQKPFKFPSKTNKKNNHLPRVELRRLPAVLRHDRSAVFEGGVLDAILHVGEDLAFVFVGILI